MRASPPIYEGTNGIQAIDLVTRKLPLAGGAAVAAHLERVARHRRSSERQQRSGFGWTPVRLERSGRKPRRAPRTGCSARLDKDADAALAGASPYLRLFGVATGGCLLAQQALAALRLGAEAAPRVALARFFAENFAVQAGALERTIVEGAPGVTRRGRRACAVDRQFN